MVQRTLYRLLLTKSLKPVNYIKDKKARKIIVFEGIVLTMKSTIPYVFYEGAVYYQFGEFSIAFAKGANNTYTAKFDNDGR